MHSAERLAAPLLAQENGGGGSGSYISLLLFVVLILAMWLFLIRPQQRQRRELQQMQSQLTVGDEVMTMGGLYGTVVETSDDTVTLEVAPGVTNRYARGAIARVINRKSDPNDGNPLKN